MPLSNSPSGSPALGPRPRSAAVVIVGDEILSGKVRDENGPWLLRRLRRWGVRAVGLEVVPDAVDRIADAIRRAIATAECAFTSGGVGPTHDDRTMAGVAEAFGEPLQEHPELAASIRRWPGDLHPARLRMAQVPGSATVFAGDGLPTVRVGSLWILPGVPRLFRQQVEALGPWLRGPRRACSALWTSKRESEIAAQLAAVEADWPGVEVGSYPLPDRRVLVTLETDDEARCRAATELLAAALSAEAWQHGYHPEDDD